MIARDVRCMACARLLGRWVIVSEAKQGMLPPSKGAPIMAVRSGRSLRCKHCGGRAYLEEPEQADISVQALLDARDP